MSRKHYIDLANRLHVTLMNLPTETAITNAFMEAVEEMCLTMKMDNPAFNKERFIHAVHCGV